MMLRRVMVGLMHAGNGCGQSLEAGQRVSSFGFCEEEE